jgi:twitching motility protein PilT
MHHANTNTQRHIVTLENPIEFLHRDVKCSVTQREIGVDTPSLRSGLQAALRQDTDVVVTENLRDPEALEYALQSVERARLVITSLVARDLQSTIEALLSLAPERDPGLLRARVAAALHAVVSLRLVPRANGEGRILVSELAILDSEMRDMIVDPARTHQLTEYVSSGRGDDANRTAAQHLSQLVRDGIVDEEVAHIVSAGSSLRNEMRGTARGGVFKAH